MNSVQLTVGNKTEQNVVNILRKNRYWVYNCPKKLGGQPVDIIALKDNINILVDAKHVEKEKVSFSFDRIEPNQITSLMYARDYAGIKNLGFAIEFERTGEIMWFPFKFYEELVKDGFKSIKMSQMALFEEVLKCIQ